MMLWVMWTGVYSLQSGRALRALFVEGGANVVLLLLLYAACIIYRTLLYIRCGTAEAERIRYILLYVDTAVYVDTALCGTACAVESVLRLVTDVAGCCYM